MPSIKDFRKIVHSDCERSKSIKINILASIGIKGVSILVSLFLVPITLNYVDSELYGIWMTLSSFMLWLNFFDIGFTLGLQNKLTEALAKGDTDLGKSLVSTTYFVMMTVFIPLCVILEVILPYIDWAHWLNINDVYNQDIIMALHVMVACFCLQMVVSVITATIAAFQRVALSSSFLVLGNVLSLIVIVILTKTAEPSLLNLSLAISSMPVIVLLVASLVLFQTKFREVKPNITSIDLRHVKDIFNLGARFFLIQIQVVILFQSTNILISNFAGPDAVTNYNIAYKYLSIAMMVYGIMLGPIWPAFTDAYTKKDYDWMNRIYVKMKKVYFLSLFIMVLMVLVSPIVYRLWVGEKIEIPFALTCCVGLYMLVHTWDTLQVSMINGIGSIKLQTYVTLFGGIVYLPLAILGGKLLGTNGIILSQVCIVTLYSICFTVQLNRILKQKASGIWIK